MWLLRIWFIFSARAGSEKSKIAWEFRGMLRATSLGSRWVKAATFTFFYKTSESSYVSPINTREKRKVMQYLDASLVSMLSAPLSSENPLNSKPIPQFDSTNYLALISRSYSTRIRYQTFLTRGLNKTVIFGSWLLDYRNANNFNFLDQRSF